MTDPPPRRLARAPGPAALPDLDEFAAEEVAIHGHRVIYRMAGDGPPVVLIHGMINSSRHWAPVARRLAREYTVIAPDLIGHGDSATPRGDYSLGAHATSIRDLLSVLGVPSATIVGHSLGGGVAMQFINQFPHRVERLVLVSSGGLGHDVSPLLRTATLPGVSSALAVAAHPHALDAMWRAGDWMTEHGSPTGAAVKSVARALRPLQGRGARQAFLHTLRAVIDVRGQRVSAHDRLYLLESMPTLIVWGERDRTIPIEHGRAAHAQAPGSRFATLPRAAHFPHLEDPEGLATLLLEFLADTEPAHLSDDEWLGTMVRRTPRTRRSSARG